MTDKDPAEVKKLAKEGDADSQLRLAVMYDKGISGLEKK